MLNKAVPYIVAIAIGAFVGGLAVDRWHRGESPAYVPEQRTAPGDVVLEVDPKAKPKLPAPTKPKGGKTTGTVEIEVDGGTPVIRKDPAVSAESETPANPNQCLNIADLTCPPVKVRLDLGVRDGQQYVAVRTEDGQEVNGVFIPRTGLPVAPRYTATGVIGDGLYVAAVSRNLGRLSVGAGLSVNDGVAAPVAVVSYGF